VFHSALANVDVIVDEGYPNHATWADLNTQYDTANAASSLRAFANGDVYTLDATMNGGGAYGGTDWYESRIAEPDAILEDLIAVLHPGSSIAATAPSNYLRDVHNGGGTMTAVTELTAASCSTELTAVRPARSTSCAVRGTSSLAFLAAGSTTCTGLNMGATPSCPALPPMPPKPSPPPASPPPVPPGATVVNVITFKATIAGTVDDFDEEAFKTNLASGLDGIEPTDITVSAAPGSVVVTSEIVTSDAAVADSTMAYLAAANETSLTDLLQVTVTAVEPPSQTSRTIDASPPPPASPSPVPIIIGVVVGVIALVFAIGVAYKFVTKAKTPTATATKGHKQASSASV